MDFLYLKLHQVCCFLYKFLTVHLPVEGDLEYLMLQAGVIQGFIDLSKVDSNGGTFWHGFNISSMVVAYQPFTSSDWTTVESGIIIINPMKPATVINITLS